MELEIVHPYNIKNRYGILIKEAKIQYIVGKWYFLRAKLIISVIACKF